MGSSAKMQSVTQATYYPATLTPEFMGAHPPTHYNNSVYDSSSGRVSYFQNYRNETLSRFSMPPYEWGVQSTPYSPRPDLVAASKVRNRDRSLALPVNDITTIDTERMKEIDDLYKSVQHHREQYKDHSGLLHPLNYFRPDEYHFQSPPGLLPTYLFKYPDTYTASKTTTDERRKNNDENSLSGVRYNVTSDMLKRKSRLNGRTYSILAKKPRLAQTNSTESLSTDLTYDGFGGHAKDDKFPSPKRFAREPKKSSRIPAKKPTFDVGTNKKIADFVSID